MCDEFFRRRSCFELGNHLGGGGSRLMYLLSHRSPPESGQAYVHARICIYMRMEERQIKYPTI